MSIFMCPECPRPDLCMGDTRMCVHGPVDPGQIDKPAPKAGEGLAPATQGATGPLGPWADKYDVTKLPPPVTSASVEAAQLRNTMFREACVALEIAGDALKATWPDRRHDPDNIVRLACALIEKSRP